MKYYVNDPTNFRKPSEQYREDELCPECNQPLKYHWNEFEKRHEQICNNMFCRVSRIYNLNTEKKYDKLD